MRQRMHGQWLRVRNAVEDMMIPEGSEKRGLKDNLY
jgi:hypothetical protein